VAGIILLFGGILISKLVIAYFERMVILAICISSALLLKSTMVKIVSATGAMAYVVYVVSIAIVDNIVFIVLGCLFIFTWYAYMAVIKDFCINFVARFLERKMVWAFKLCDKKFGVESIDLSHSFIEQSGDDLVDPMFDEPAETTMDLPEIKEVAVAAAELDEPNEVKEVVADAVVADAVVADEVAFAAAVVAAADAADEVAFAAVVAAAAADAALGEVKDDYVFMEVDNDEVVLAEEDCEKAKVEIEAERDGVMLTKEDFMKKEM
jgi:hypothetical protein